MALFSSRNRNVFQPTAYGSRRRRRGVPRWLVLILTGVAVGAGGVLFLQKSYGPTRLTVEQSEQLHQDLNSANIDKQRLQSQLNQATHSLGETRTALESRTQQLQQTREDTVQEREDIQLFLNAMPPDPRGTSPGIRAADFRNDAGQLAYQILIMQDKTDSPIFEGDMELVVEGRYPSGKTANVTLDPVRVSIPRYDFVQGSALLPEAFTARQVTIRIKPKDGGKTVATRTIRVSR